MYKYVPYIVLQNVYAVYARCIENIFTPCRHSSGVVDSVISATIVIY
jgi:hypothetical protein